MDGYESEDEIESLFPCTWQWETAEPVAGSSQPPSHAKNGAIENAHPKPEPEASPDSAQEEHLHQRCPSDAGSESGWTDDDGEEKICRICFSGKEEEKDLGRLISPCLCSGSMRHVHIKCINAWRGSGRNPTSFYQCTQCRFTYHLSRTLITDLSSSRFLILLTSIIIFLLLTLLTGTLLDLVLRSRGFREWIVAPVQQMERAQREREKQFFTTTATAPAAAPLGDGWGWARGFWGGFWGVSVWDLNGVGTGPLGGLADLVIKAVGVFASGEAEEVVAETFMALRESTSSLHLPIQVALPCVAIPVSPPLPNWTHAILLALWQRLSLGFSLIGIMSFISLLISSSLLGPLQLANNLRVGRWFGLGGGARRADGEGRRGGRGVGLGSGLIVLVVVMGAIRTIKQLYSLTTSMSQWILLKAETAILEVNPRGEEIGARDRRQKERVAPAVEVTPVERARARRRGWRVVADGEL